MKRAEAEKLLGGYATGTLTEAERRALFEAAWADQELFNAVADEEALRELLADASVRRRLLAALAEGEAGLWERMLAWWQRPWAWGVAGSVAVAAVLVVMLLPEYQATKRPAVRTAPAGRHAAEGQRVKAEAGQVAQGPLEMAKKGEPTAPLPPPALSPAAVPRRQRAAAPLKSMVTATEAPVQQVPGPAEEKQMVAETVRAAPASRVAAERERGEASAVRTAPAGRLEAERPREQAEVKPKPESAPAGVVGGVVGAVVAAAPPPPPPKVAVPSTATLEADARRLYNAPAAEWKDVRRAEFRAQRAADVAAAPAGPVGIRYAILRLEPEGQYSEVAPGTVFAKGDVVRLSVEANQNGVIRLTRQDATGAWIAVGQVTVEARMRQAIPAEGLRLEKPEKLAVEFVRGGAEPALAGKPRLQKAADEHAVYVVEASGASPVRAEIELSVR